MHAFRDHPLIGHLEIGDAQEQSDAASELPPDGVQLALALGTRKQEARLASNGPNDDPSFGTPVIG